ncbi:MAG: hypothetical protein ACRCT1_19730 [Microcoleaceae cyanobacterium]|jgi:hypothetical protein
MEISRPNAKELTPEEKQELAKLKAMIERAVADAVLTAQEIEDLRSVTRRHTETMSQDLLYEELELYRTLVTEKVRKGELAYTD